MSDELLVKNVAAWRRWLHANHAKSDGEWLVLARKGTTSPTSLTYDEALDEALCYGWIDGQAKSRDATTRLQRWTPRRKRSNWSLRNTQIAQRLIKEGRMQPAGLAEMERAKADGRWAAAYAGPAAATVPGDLVAALAKRPNAKAMFEILSSRNRFAVLYRIQDAKRPETRSRRIQQFVEMLAKGETVYPQKQKLPG